MQWKNTPESFGALAKLFHWTTAAAFIGAYAAVYYYLWFLDVELPESWLVLNVHWALGILAGALVLPRLLWRLVNVQPEDPPGSLLEHRLAHAAHWALYGLMLLMPLTGYLGTGGPTDLGLFSAPSFKDTAVFGWLSATFSLSWEAFESPFDAVHHFTGKWIAWVVVGLHVAAAMFHHLVRGDEVLVRMLPMIKLRMARQDGVSDGRPRGQIWQVWRRR